MSNENVKKPIKIPRCKLEFRDGKAVIVCLTKADQKQAYSLVAEGIIIEVKKPKVELGE